MPQPNELAAGVNALTSFFFDLTMFGQPVEGVTEISGVSLENKPVDLKQTLPTGKLHQAKIPGAAVAPGTFNVKIATGPGSKIEKQFFEGLFKGEHERGQVMVTLYDQLHAKVLQWTFDGAWIKDLGWGDLSAGEPQVTVLDLTIQYNDAKVTK